MNVRKCNECGQALPESFEPPAVEPWSTGIFGCAEDTESCKFYTLNHTSSIHISLPWNLAGIGIQFHSDPGNGIHNS